ncbi:hypothetical protein RBA63_18585 [Brenneria goodwinii]|uniref:hypothetical protein n=1 Tax=Brenneria goodwinii TaxID=1109412 RepID=UPI0036E1B449
MKRLLTLLCVLALLPLSAHAGSITMSNPDQSTTENGRTLCIYQNSIYTFTYITKSKSCPYSKTFNTGDSD